VAGSRGDLTRDDAGVLDAAKFGLKGSGHIVEATLADMLTVLSGKAIDHGRLLFASR
jgi:hypothetical protein